MQRRSASLHRNEKSQISKRGMLAVVVSSLPPALKLADASKVIVTYRVARYASPAGVGKKART